MSDTLKARGIAAVVWDFFGKLARYLTGFVVTVVLARLLEPSDFGLIAMIMVIVMVAMVFTDVGLGTALIQRRRVLDIHYSSVFYFNLLIGTVLGVATFLSAGAIGNFYHSEALIPLTQAMSLLFVINAFSAVQTKILRKNLDYASMTKANVGAAVLSGILGIVMALAGFGVWSLVAQQLSRGVFYNIFVWRASGWVPSLRFSIKALKQLWGFGFRMFLSAILEAIYSRLDVIIIGRLFPPAALGFFDQAKRLNAMIIQYASGSIMSVMFPVLSHIQNDLPRFQRISIKTLGIISFIIFALLGTMYVIAEELIVLLFTDKWLPAVDFFKLLLLSGYGYPVSALLVNILSSRGNSKAFLRLEIYKKVIQTLNLSIAFFWGIFGYLYGLVIVTVLGVSLNILFASREIDLPIGSFARPILVQMGIGILSAVLTLMLANFMEFHAIISLVLKAIVFITLYFLINKTARTEEYRDFTKEFVHIVEKVKKRKK